ncbi:Dipeptidyl peptidase 8 [Schistosoma japonicum]|nr:Dipeptidyl peptidase 8 [Schistosoma japonicum]KAH8856314.1 Dipeptidyl peptidase 8 [Schistosoma japonicum]
MSESDSSNESMYMFERFHQVAASYGFALHTFSIPTLINIRKISNFENKLCCRVYFISYPPSNFQPGSKPTLFCTDIILQNSSDDDQLIWYPLLPNEFVDDKNSLALADFLIHERMRISVSGITNYCLSDCGKLIICASSQIYSAKDSTCFGEQPNYLEPIKASLTNVIQPIMCPLNSDIVVCLSNENIFIGYVPTNTWISITNYTSNSGLSAGIPPFVVQEEFDRYIGYWWRPTLTNDGFYQLLYEEVDERNVAVTRLFHGESGGGWENQRYPSADSSDNPSSISDVQTFALRLPLKQYIPNFEYLVRVGWTPDGNLGYFIGVAVLNDLDNFLPISNVVDLNSSSSSISNCLPSFATSPCIELVSEVESKFWIKVHDFLTFLKQPWYSKEMDNSLNSSSSLPTDHDCCTFIWASHRTGFTHLYLIQCSWPKTNLKTMCHNETILHEKNTGVLINAKQEFVYQLTSGDWEVTGNQIWLDEENKFVYFEAFKEHPLLRHIFAHAQLFCHFGYAVFLCDCRGSANRGINFDGYIKNRLGQVELDDHVAFLKYAAKSTGFIDLSRIAIMGYSFGGYMSLMAAMRCHDVYKAAIAISPVVDWLLYDTAYTERYIGLPEDNPEAYTKGNVMEYVSNMPSNKDHLIIFHGGQDENVHFLHTSSLIEKLDASGKPHQFQVF